MNTIVFDKLGGAVLFEDRSVPERERGGRPYGGVLDSPHVRPEMGIPDGPPLKDNLGLRHRRTGARQNGGKVRHKRQALQDMARPLKQWLYKHRDNPYPTKTEKILLALGSQMTLVQVSNWFANARRRLKNTVRQPDLSWALRIKLYNKYVQGNAERLSVSSDDSCSEDGENPPRNHMNEGGYNNPVHHPVIKSESSAIKAGVRPESRANEDYVSPPKYKSSLLNRYLNDSLRHVMATNAVMMGKTRQRNHSGSFSSNEFEEELVSPSSSETEGNFVYRPGLGIQIMVPLFGHAGMNAGGCLPLEAIAQGLFSTAPKVSSPHFLWSSFLDHNPPAPAIAPSPRRSHTLTMLSRYHLPNCELLGDEVQL
ncbi:homeobox protein Mohawk isoform X1 [Pteropus vampyrus]|uniref:Homeobox protein Mohawk isoform X1 n=1 Tax=Pteropus vampyrus TaxID=132908 RepID=A0A6P6CWL3_PTEVA|nr:homeobox protein Mohawk isoform X1 [Pteropus vampyrus]XP_023391929.1 homeobox protein Mohawk isoform X1 [Pteropus vampyrus]XP_023391930.1 homeobox protein Mohawk isoform X1 [Pteropus vampyrus]XP_023391931.1 homeobox protein Mohawk isoform X1 [Pteropus vampyrus]XP_023391932.1 homeobox protein Mohawk isoform X1 [Pteropus vampyrus]